MLIRIAINIYICSSMYDTMLEYVLVSCQYV